PQGGAHDGSGWYASPAEAVRTLPPGETRRDDRGAERGGSECPDLPPPRGSAWRPPGHADRDTGRRRPRRAQRAEPLAPAARRSIAGRAGGPSPDALADTTLVA